jgi:predicted kinase
VFGKIILMNKHKLTKPVMVYLYGLPGSGKTYISRQLCEFFNMAHISSDRLRYELFEEPKHDKAENMIVSHLMDYISEEFLSCGLSVVYDMSVSRTADRRSIREMAARLKAKELLVWVQVDIDTAWTRTQSRDKRKADDKYSTPLTQEMFESYMKNMQNPSSENYLVLSGKHLFNSHKNAFLRRFDEMGILNLAPNNQVLPKPGLVNLISQAQNQAARADFSRRNLTIR